DTLPLPLSHFILAHPEAFGQRHVDLHLVRAPLGFVGRASHTEPARRAPAERDAADLALVSALDAEEGFLAGRRHWCTGPRAIVAHFRRNGVTSGVDQH